MSSHVQLRVWIPADLSARLSRHAYAAARSPRAVVCDALARYLDDADRGAAPAAAPVEPEVRP